MLAIGVICLRPLLFRLLLGLSEVASTNPKRILILGVSSEARRVAAALSGDGGNEIQIARLPIVREARSLGIEPQVVQRPGLALDVDTPADLAAFIATPSATRVFSSANNS